MLEKKDDSKKEHEIKVAEPSKETIENNEAVDAIENSMAEDAENEKSEKEIEKVDYTKLSLEELVLALKKTLSENPVHQVKNQVEGIRSAFNTKFGALLAKKKEAFLAEGGNSIDFRFDSPLKSEYNQILSNYKKERDAYYADLEKRFNANLEQRLAVIESLKTLIDDAKPATMYNEFRKIQEVWKSIGPVPKTRYNDTWKTYHHHVERFYDLLHMSNDFRDLDFKHNLEEKLEIIKQAHELKSEPDVNIAAKKLQELHRKWKEDVGPVAREMREEVWHKFSSITKEIHDRRHQYFREMRSKFNDIIANKLVIVEKINSYDTSSNISHNDWQKSIKEIEKLRQEYFDAGKLPYSKSEEVWQKFKAATKKFNSAKNAFYKEEKNKQQENLKKKKELIAIAESLKDSEDWDTTTNMMKKIQADWKKIGHVPRKFSDDIWKQFKNACNHYFDRLHNQKNKISSEQQEVVDAKKAFLEQLKTAKKAASKEEVIASINNWNNLGKLPRNARHLEGKFSKQIDTMLNDLSLDKKEASMLKFTNTVDGYLVNEEIKKLNGEQAFVRKRIDEIVREIQQLENNLSFISNADDDNPLVVNVKNKVDTYKKDLEAWKEKLEYLKKLDY